MILVQHNMMSYNSEICLECWEESNEVHSLKKPLTEVGSCKVCPWDTCWFQSRLSKNKETKFVTVLQLISHEFLSCVSLWLEQLGHKSLPILTSLELIGNHREALGFCRKFLHSIGGYNSMIRLCHHNPV